MPERGQGLRERRGNRFAITAATPFHPKTGAELVCEHCLSFKDKEPVGEVPRARSSNRTVRKQQPPTALSYIRNLSNKRLRDANDPGRARAYTGASLCFMGPSVCLPFHCREMFLKVALQPSLVR